MLHSKKIAAQQVLNYCLVNDVKSVVISPGSRNAPLIIEFNAQDTIKKYSIVDERSAAFFALGIAQETCKPVALLCSSGTALLNYYPAITEAYYSKIPLIVISADRPKHLIDIGDGQTIRQVDVFRNHVQFSANLSEKNSDENDTLLKRIFKKLKQFKTPIHINIPFSEPLYETTEHLLHQVDNLSELYKSDSLLTETPIDVDELQGYADVWNKATKKMIILGVHPPDKMLAIQLEHIAKDASVIVLTETTSNVHNTDFINSIDQLVFPFSNEVFKDYQPDILLTFGGMVISKKIKELLRENPPKQHWHIDSNRAMDTYHCLTKHFSVSITLFFSQFFFLIKAKESNYKKLWITAKKQREEKHEEYLVNIAFSDLKVFQLLSGFLPKQLNIQFSNSSIIRYAQLFSWLKTQKIGCNRGTSGIDGSTSTAVGVAVAGKKQSLLISGDLSFFYDSNALWNKYIPNNFRIILINNRGGGIFRFIPGPTTTNTLEFFETPHQLTAKQLCEMHHFEYKTVSNSNDLQNELGSFFDESSRPKLLEIATPKEKNALILKDYFKYLSESL